MVTQHGRRLRGHDPKKAAPSRPKIVIYGKPGTGKTWGAIEFPSVYYIDTEGGADLPHYTDKLKASGGTYLGPKDGANDFGVIVEEVITLATTEHNYRTLVIDSFSKVYNTAIQIEWDRLQSNGADMGKTFGREKKPAIAYTRQLIRWFEKLDMNVILVCHVRDEWRNGEMVGTTFDAWDRLEYELHLVLNNFTAGPQFLCRVGKNRLAQFKQGDTFPWSYAEFARRYGADVMEAFAGHVEPATPEQVIEVTALADEAVKQDVIAGSALLRWFDKAGVTEWRQMDGETIQKCIDHLRVSLGPQ